MEKDESIRMSTWDTDPNQWLKAIKDGVTNKLLKIAPCIHKIDKYKGMRSSIRVEKSTDQTKRQDLEMTAISDPKNTSQ
jgi:hypothetical protein